MSKRVHEPERLRVWPSFALPILAAALTLWAGFATVRLFLDLPLAQVERVSEQAWSEALERVLRSGDRRVTDGWAACVASNRFTALWFTPEPAPDAEASVAEFADGLRTSRVGRLQRAAARLWALHDKQRARNSGPGSTPGTEPGRYVDSWPHLHKYLRGLERADLSHNLMPLLDAATLEYARLGLGPGTAREYALMQFATTHGPFLEYVTQQLRAQARQRDSADDPAGAALCRGVALNLLRTWVLEPGPAGLRLLAADLLAEVLSVDFAGDPQAQAVASQLRAWRNAYRTTAQRRPVVLLTLHNQPAVRPVEYARYADRLVLTTWTLSATLLSALVAAALLIPQVRQRWRRGALIRLLAVGAVAACAVIAVGALWIWAYPNAVAEDLQTDTFGTRYIWRHPFIAAGATALLIGIGTAVYRAAASRWVRLGRVSLAVWLLLAVSVLLITALGRRAQDRYERARNAALRDPIAAMLGPEAEEPLNALRTWSPG